MSTINNNGGHVSSGCQKKQADYLFANARHGRFIFTALGCFIFACLIFLASCTKQDLEDYGGTLTPFTDYLPTKAGDISYYTLDSIVAAPFGTSMDTVHYYAKDSVSLPEMTAQDTTYRVYRYLTATSLQNPWTYQLTYRLVFTQHTAALIDEHNRRFIILTDPVRQDYSWEGNRYFSSDLNPGDFYYGWNYTYDMSNGKNLIIVHQTDQTNGNPGDFDPSLYQEKLFAEMRFTKDIGLNSQSVSHIIYQANQNNPNTFGYYEQDSYGIVITRLAKPPVP